MDKIDGSKLIPSPQLDSFQGTTRSDKADSGKGIPVGTKASENQAKTGDTVEISAKAKKLMEMRQVYESGLESLEQGPEVREEKVDEARARLNAGFYNSAQVREKVADEVADAFRGIDEL